MRNMLFIIALFSACTKSGGNIAEDGGCIDQLVIPLTAHAIAADEVAIADQLFQNNGIPNANLRYFQYTQDTLQTLSPPYSRFEEKNIRVDQYLNGMRIFTGDLIFHFIEGRLTFQGGQVTGGTNLDAKASLSTGQVRTLFLNSIDQVDHAREQYADSCFKAEFGYFNLNAGTSYAPEKLVKAWRVTTKNSVPLAEYPIAYYEDNGKLISYDNGIRY